MSDAEPRGLPRQVKGLAAVSLLNDFASEMVYPLLPAFLTRTLGAGPIALGALDGASDLVASVLRWGSGRLADRPGWRVRLIGSGYLIAVLFRPVVALATAAWQVVAIRMVDRLGKGLRSPARDALLADLTPGPLHGRAFGLHRSADHLGAVLGALVAWELVRRGLPIRDVLALSVIPGVLTLITLWVTLGRRADMRAGLHPPLQQPAVPAAVESKVPSALVLLALVAAVRLPETLLLLRLQDVGLPVAMAPLLWAVLHVVRSASSYPAGMATDRLGVNATLGLGAVIYAATIAGMGATSAAATSIVLFLGHGLAAGLLEPAERAAVARVVGTRRGRAFGTYQSIAGVGALASGLGYGWLYQAGGGAVALAAAGGLVTVAVAAWLSRGREAGRRVDGG